MSYLFMKRVLLFLLGMAAAFAVMFYLTWGSYGMMDDGDLLGLTRLYSIMAGAVFVGIWGRT